MMADCHDRGFVGDPTRLHSVRMIMRRILSIILDCSIHDLLYATKDLNRCPITRIHR